MSAGSSGDLASHRCEGCQCVRGSPGRFVRQSVTGDGAAAVYRFDRTERIGGGIYREETIGPEASTT